MSTRASNQARRHTRSPLFPSFEPPPPCEAKAQLEADGDVERPKPCARSTARQHRGRPITSSQHRGRPITSSTAPGPSDHQFDSTGRRCRAVLARAGARGGADPPKSSAAELNLRKLNLRNCRAVLARRPARPSARLVCAGGSAARDERYGMGAWRVGSFWSHLPSPRLPAPRGDSVCARGSAAFQTRAPPPAGSGSTGVGSLNCIACARCAEPYAHMM